jgi:UbiA prenyltransferase family
MKVAWTVQVRAGVTVSSERDAPARAKASMCGVCGPICRKASPATMITRAGRIKLDRLVSESDSRILRPPLTLSNRESNIEGTLPVRSSGPTVGEISAMTIAARSELVVTLLKLGRVSNLPTVWTNVLVGAVLAGGDWQHRQLVIMLVAMSLYYVGGMYLNDYFDRAIDNRERPDRPIPSKLIAASTVATIGYGLIGAGTVATALMGPTAVLLAALLAISIVTYNFYHKGNRFAPVVMGVCRALVYCATAAALSGAVSTSLIVWGVAIAAYVAGLTYAARQESLDTVGNLWPLALLSAPILVAAGAFRQGTGALAIYLLLLSCTVAAVYLLARRPSPGSVSRAVGWLIAGISLCDAAMLASVDAITPALWAVGGFLLTLFAQRYVSGT